MQVWKEKNWASRGNKCGPGVDNSSYVMVDGGGPLTRGNCFRGSGMFGRLGYIIYLLDLELLVTWPANPGHTPVLNLLDK